LGSRRPGEAKEKRKKRKKAGVRDPYLKKVQQQKRRDEKE